MTLEEFVVITRERIPTATEFLAFVGGQGWSIAVRDDGVAVLRGARRNDALAVTLARMLSREPYRSNVLALVAPPAPAAPTPDPLATLYSGPDQQEAPLAKVASGAEQQPLPLAILSSGEPVRQWLWRDGHRYTEETARQVEAHPVGAWWWRYRGETAWRLIEERVARADLFAASLAVATGF